MSVVAIVLAAAVSASPAVKLLGYDPEAPQYSECEKRETTARFVTVALAANKPLPERLTAYLTLAGLYGAANAACPPGRTRLVLPQGPTKSIVWDATACSAAADAAWAPSVKAQVADINLKAHPDIAAGFADAIADAITPIRQACDPHPAFAKLEVAIRENRSHARSMRSLRGCLLWRRAASAEYDTAKTLGETKGRAAGLAYLNGPAMLATAQSKMVCEAQAKANGSVDSSAFQIMLMSLVKTAIEAMPEKPVRP